MTMSGSMNGGANGITVGDINVSVSGVEDPRAIADVVAQELLLAIKKSTYTDIYTT